MTHIARAIFVALAFLAPVAASAQRDSTLIATAQRTSVRSLDASLAATPFAAWLGRVRSLPSSRIHWEVNDCGEGGDGRAAPTCVEAILDVAPDTTARVSVIVGDIQAKPTAPAIFMLTVMAGKSVITFKTLPQWAAFVRRLR